MTDAAPTVDDVAAWMVEEMARGDGILGQEDAAAQIERKFGSAFVYDNSSGNLSISKEVLAAFRKLTPDIVWDRSERAWRTREKTDGEGRQSE